MSPQPQKAISRFFVNIYVRFGWSLGMVSSEGCRCQEGRCSKVMLSAATIYSLHRPSRCGLRLWLQTRGEPAAEPGPFERVLERLGRRHEQHHLSTLGPVIDLSGGDFAERAKRTRDEIRQKAPVLYQPAFISEILVGGKAVPIAGVPDFLLQQGDTYRIRDCKLALNADGEHHPEILRQAELYGWLFEMTVGRPPACLEIVLGNSSIVEVAYDRGVRVVPLLEELWQIANRREEPYEPVGWSKCQGCPFRPRCWSRAEKAKNLALVHGVDQGLARALREMGVTRIHELVRRFDEQSLADLERPWGRQSRRVGAAAGRILCQADAMLRGSEIRLAVPRLPDADNCVVFDVEGMPPYLSELDKVYLWATQVFGADPGEYHADVAGFAEDGDRDAWARFLSHCQTLFARYGDIPFLHWHAYETTKLRLYVGRYGDPDDVAARVLANCVDLLPITRDAVALPTPSYSLKVVEQHVGFKRQLDEYGGEWSMAKYIEATETGDEAERQAIMDQIISYNREDLEATWAVFQWLSSVNAPDP